jgi:hypothetical protein
LRSTRAGEGFTAAIRELWRIKVDTGSELAHRP